MRRILCLVVFFYSSISAATAADNWEDSELFRSFTAMLNAWQSMQIDLKSQSGTLTSAEAQNYQAYLNSLQQTLSKQCHQLSTAYQTFPALQFGCQPAVRLSAQQIKQQRVAKLNREFFDDLSKIDEILLREQQELEQQHSASASSGGNTPDSHSYQSNAGNQNNTNKYGGPNDTKNQHQQQHNKQHAFGSETPAPVAGKDLPPDAQDDDIVARQLREAAENEHSPELKRKLWDEYKRYKSSI